MDVGLDSGSRARERRLAVLRCVLRCALSCAALLVVYFVLPIGGFGPGVGAIIALIVGGVIFILVFAWQLRSITRAADPRLRAIETLVMSIMLFVVIFSTAYLILSDFNAGSFSERLDRVGALYFPVVTLGTVGFGDIAAKSELARILVTVQVLLDLAFFAVIVRLVTTVSRRSIGSRATDGSHPSR
jgi:Ion channel.